MVGSPRFWHRLRLISIVVPREWFRADRYSIDFTPSFEVSMDWTHNTIWTEQLPPGTYSSVDLLGGASAVSVATSATYANLHHFNTKEPGFQELHGKLSLDYLEVNHSNVKSLYGVAELGPIKRLELFWFLKLESDDGLAGLADSLEWLHISTARKFSASAGLRSLAKLKVLRLNDCGPIDNLSFLAKMPNLLDFRFVGTNVLDGDLTPIIKHPSLLDVSFSNKRHYNMKLADFAEHFNNADSEAKEYVYKGDFRTFRYKGLDGSRQSHVESVTVRT
jgi:hypothetical protein